MAVEKSAGQPEAGLHFQRVVAKFAVPGGALRDEMGCTIAPSGRVVLNTAATEAMFQLGQQLGLEFGVFAVALGVNPETHTVALYPVDFAQEGIMPVRQTASSRTLFTHIGPVFQQYPHLRPSGVRQCSVAVRTDAAGQPCMVISLQTAMVKRRQRRGAPPPASQPEAGGEAAAAPAWARADEAAAGQMPSDPE